MINKNIDVRDNETNKINVAESEIKVNAPRMNDMPNEINGPKGPEPTRYGDWEQNGRCTDF